MPSQVPLISGEIKRFLRDDGLVKVSRSLKENGWKINRVVEQQKREKGRDVTIEELVQETGLSREEIVMAMEANIHVESLYKSVYQSDGSEIYLVDQVVAGGRNGLGTEAGSIADNPQRSFLKSDPSLTSPALFSVHHGNTLKIR